MQTYYLNTETLWVTRHSEPLAGGQIYSLQHSMNSYDPYANLISRLNYIVCPVSMAFDGIVPLRCHPHRLETVDRMSSDVNRINDSDVLDGIEFVTGEIKDKVRKYRSLKRLNTFNFTESFRKS